MEWITWLSAAATIIGDITVIFGLLAVCIKPIRKRLLVDKDARNGQLCLLRSEIVRTYYRHLDEKKMRQFEYENVDLCYKAYVALGGNSFVKHIFDEMQEWTILP